MSLYSTLQELLVLMDHFPLRKPVVVSPFRCRIIFFSTWKCKAKQEDFPGLKIRG